MSMLWTERLLLPNGAVTTFPPAFHRALSDCSGMGCWVWSNRVRCEAHGLARLAAVARGEVQRQLRRRGLGVASASGLGGCLW